MAQVGSRLIDAAAAKIAEDFFKAFEAHLQAKAAGEPVVAAPAASIMSNRLWWMLGAAVLLAAIYFLSL